MIGAFLAIACCLHRQAVPTPLPEPAPVTATADPGGDTGGFTLNPWTMVKRDLRKQAEASLAMAADALRVTTSTPDLGATPYLRDLWSWGRAVLTGAGILALVVLASAADGMWPGLNRYAAGAVLPRLVVAVALLNAGPALLSMVSAAGNGLTAEAVHLMPTTVSLRQSLLAMGQLPLVLAPLAIACGVLISLMGIIRSFLLALFVVAGPFANATFAWPGVDRWGKTWWRSIVVLAVVLPMAQAVLAGVTLETAAHQSLNLAGSAAWQQAALVVVAVAFQAIVPLGLIVFSLKPVNTTMGVAAGLRTWRAVKQVAAAAG